MLRPSMSRGLPALGCAESGTSHTADSRSTVSSIGAGPTLQFTPTTSAPRAARAGPNCSGGVPSRLLPSSSVVTSATIGSAHADAGGLDRRSGLVPVAERLEDQQVHAALDQGFGLLAEVLARLVDAGLAPGLDAHAQRTDGAGHVGGVAGHLARQPGAGAVDLAHLVAEPEPAQLHPRGPEGVGLEDVGAGGEVLAVHAGHQVGLRQVQRFEAAVDEDAPPVQHRAHRAVADEDARAQGVEEGKPGHQGTAGAKPPSAGVGDRQRLACGAAAPDGSGTSSSDLSHTKSSLL